MRCSHIDMNTCSAPPQQGQQPHNNKANGESSDSVYAKKRHRARDGLSLLQRLRRHQCSSTSMPPAMQRPTVWPLIDTFVFCSHLFVVILFAKFYRRLAVPWPAELRPNLLVLDECVSAARDQHSATRDRSVGVRWRASKYRERQLCRAWIQSTSIHETRGEEPPCRRREWVVAYPCSP